MVVFEFEVVNKFVLDFYKCLKSIDKFVGENFFYFFVSLLIVFVMIFFGMRGNIVLELMKVLYVDLVLLDDLGKSMKNFIDSLNRVSDENNRFLIVN